MKITYKNKVALMDDETISDENKVTADDMNEIKEVVNDNADKLETKQGKEEGKGLSTNDFTDELKEKIESLENYDDAELKQKNTEQDKTLEALQKENIELKAENERLNNDINAISVTEQAEGENITLNDTAEARFKSFGIGGNSWQETGDVTDEEGNIIGIMPSPNYKSEIQNVTGNANVKIYNKNLIPDVFFTNDEKSKTLNGITATINADNTIKVSGTATVRTILDFKNFNLKFKGKRNYQYISNSPSLDCRIEIYTKADGKDQFLNSYNAIANINTKVQNLLEIINAYIVISEGQTVNTTLYFFIQEENSDTSYAEHQEQNFSFPLAEGQRLMKGDYLADDGIHHKRGQYVFTGAENLEDYTMQIEGYYKAFTADIKTNSKFSSATNPLCNYFIAKSVNYTKEDGSGIYSSQYATYISVPNTVATNVNELKSYLAELYSNGAPVILEYELAEEEIEPYTPEQQAVYDEIKKTAHSYGEQTHIFSIDETSLIFNVEARKDMNTVISNLESMILANASEEV